jgi:hypothetical protein
MLCCFYPEILTQDIGEQLFLGKIRLIPFLRKMAQWILPPDAELSFLCKPFL